MTNLLHNENQVSKTYVASMVWFIHKKVSVKFTETTL